MKLQPIKKEFYSKDLNIAYAKGFQEGKAEGEAEGFDKGICKATYPLAYKKGRSETIKEILEMILKYNPSKSNMMYNEVVAELWTDLNAKLKEVKE